MNMTTANSSGNKRNRRCIGYPVAKAYLELTGDELAVLTHYIHNKEYFDNEKGEKEARKYIPEEILEDSPEEYDLFSDFFDVPFPEPTVPNFTFIDLFAGMGGFRLGMQAQGGKCVFSSEWNKYAQKTYLANFGEMPFGDITKKSTKSYIPKKFDFLASPSLLLGFPKKTAWEGKLDLKIRRKERYFSMSLK